MTRSGNSCCLKKLEPVSLHFIVSKELLTSQIQALFVLKEALRFPPARGLAPNLTPWWYSWEER